MFGWFRRHCGWPSRVRVRVADIGPEARALRRLIVTWLPEAPDLRPALRRGQIEIVVLHHVRLDGQSGPVVPALTERVASLTRVSLGRFRPGAAPGWHPYTTAELLTALEVHLQAMARGYERPVTWWPGVEAVVDPAVVVAPAALLSAPAAPTGATRRPALSVPRRLRVSRWPSRTANVPAADPQPSDQHTADAAAAEAVPPDQPVSDQPATAQPVEAERWPLDGTARPE